MISLEPIGTAYNSREEVRDDDWGNIVTAICLDPSLPDESLYGIELFSHAEIIFYFHQADKNKIETGARHPRGNKSLPKTGIFAQRGKNRPNLLGHTIVKIIKKEGRELFVQGLDCINGTPVLDIKPVMEEFLPEGPIEQPDWTREIMKNYW